MTEQELRDLEKSATTISIFAVVLDILLCVIIVGCIMSGAIVKAIPLIIILIGVTAYTFSKRNRVREQKAQFIHLDDVDDISEDSE